MRRADGCEPELLPLLRAGIPVAVSGIPFSRCLLLVLALLLPPTLRMKFGKEPVVAPGHMLADLSRSRLPVDCQHWLIFRSPNLATGTQASSGAPSGVHRTVSVLCDNLLSCCALRKSGIYTVALGLRPYYRLSSCACRAHAALLCREAFSAMHHFRRAQQPAHQPHCIPLPWPDCPVFCNLQRLSPFPGIAAVLD